MKRLIVVAPSLSGFKGWEPLIDRLSKEDELKGAEWCLWNHHKHIYSGGHLTQLARDLRATIDAQWAASGGFDDVILVGHSVGGLLMRMAYLLGAGEDPVIRQSSPWAARVSRIILLAGLSRGVDPTRNVVVRFDNWLERFLPSWMRRLSSEMYRGSAVVTNLRIQWIRYMAKLGAKAPVVIQLIGTKDDLVTRADSTDIEQFANGYYVSIPGAGHADLHRLDIKGNSAGRYALLRDAFVNVRPVLAENVEITGPKDVVFVVHGIRADNRTWVQDTIAEIKAKWPETEPIGPRYPFVSALRFALPTRRRRHLRWFQDAYSEALARNPAARFNFIGHSNGTYLLGESMRAIPGMCFDRATLVGSVLPQDYNWNVLLERKQIKSIRVDGSARDWPVGVLCSALRGMGMKDVGTGGFEGFLNFGNAQQLHEYLWYDGGHSAPLAKENLAALARFAVAGELVAPRQLLNRANTYSVASRIARVLGPVALGALAIGLIVLLVTKLFWGLSVILLLALVALALDVT